jgi:hypothetical protein
MSNTVLDTLRCSLRIRMESNWSTYTRRYGQPNKGCTQLVDGSISRTMYRLALTSSSRLAPNPALEPTAASCLARLRFARRRPLSPNIGRRVRAPYALDLVLSVSKDESLRCGSS